MLETQVHMNVNLGQSEITLNDLMGLKVGDVIPLDQDTTGEFDVLVEGVPKFKSLLRKEFITGRVAVQGYTPD